MSELPPSHPNVRPAAFFDRDGVINVDHGYVDTPGRFELVDGAGAALAACRAAGYLVFIVTNQSGVARGYFDEAALSVLHDHMRTVLAVDGGLIDDIRFCPHHIDAVDPRYRRACSWRKPAPGMILDLAETWHVDLTRSFLVGDKTTDIEAAHAAHVRGYQFEGGNLHDFILPILTA
jgi:D-glycero-D-manno-heptose 1,7-bisphosphate phosphatase